MNRCLRLHQEMRSHSIVPSRLHYNTLLNVALQDEFANAKAATEVTSAPFFELEADTRIIIV